MNLTTFKATLRRSGALVATLVVIAVAVISLATIWFLRDNEGPVAPTAPTSQPQASGNVCSVQWIVRNECSGFKVYNADTQQEIPAGTAIDAGTKVQWSCEGLPGTNFWKYRYQSSPTGEMKLHYEAKKGQMADPDNPRSTPLDTTGMDHLILRCKPFAGKWGALPTTVQTACTRTMTFTTDEIPPAQCNESCSEDTDCADGRTCSNGMCRNQECTGEADCTCNEVDPPKQCNESCSVDTDCADGRTCSNGMCRNQECTGEADCTCGQEPTPLTCTTGAFTEAFTDATIDAKLAQIGGGTLTVTGGVGQISINNAAAPYDARKGLQSSALIQGEIEAKVDVKAVSANGLTRLQLVNSAEDKSYRMDWRRGVNGGNAVSQIVTEEVTLTNGTPTVSGQKVANIAADSTVTFRIEREGSTVRMYYKVNTAAEVLHATYTGASMPLRARTVSGLSSMSAPVTSTIDNFALACIPEDPDPAMCNESCSEDSDCAGGRICSGGMCRNQECTGETDCTCNEDPEPAMCNESCSEDADCDDGLTCHSNGMCRKPACTGEADCTCDVDEEEEDKDSSLRTTTLSCTNQNFDAHLTLSENDEPKSGVNVVFKYNGQTIERETGSNGRATAGFRFSSGKVLVVEPEDGFRSHSREITFTEECPTGGTPNPTPVATNPPQSTPTPTPVAGCNNTCVTSTDCGNGLTCSSGQCRNPSCTNQTNCTCLVASGATPTPAPTLPTAGSTGQTVAVLAIGSLVIGLGLSRAAFFRRS